MCRQGLLCCKRHFLQIADFYRSPQNSKRFHSQYIFYLFSHINQIFVRCIIVNTASICIFCHCAGNFGAFFINPSVIGKKMVCTIVSIQLNVIHIYACVALQQQPSNLTSP